MYIKGVPNECLCNANGLPAGSVYSLSLLHTVPYITSFFFFFFFFLAKPHSKSKRLNDTIVKRKVITACNHTFKLLKYYFTYCIIYSSFHNEKRPPLWPSSQSSWLLTQRSRVRFKRYRIFLSSSGSLERQSLSRYSSLAD
jgi:hypothetical protein